MTRHEFRPDDRQVASVREELHAAVDAACDWWQQADRQSRDMERGFPSSTAGAGRRGSDPTAGAALADEEDPARMAADWLAHFTEFLGHARTLVGELRRLKPADPTELERHRAGYAAPVESCVGCGDAVRPGEVKRIDGDPTHRGPCYWRVYNQRRGRRGA